MRFTEFVDINKYDIAKRNDIIKVFQKFLLTNQLLSFTQAIMRDEKSAQSLKSKINEYLDNYLKIYQNLPLNQFIDALELKNKELKDEEGAVALKKSTFNHVKKWLSPTLIRDPRLVDIIYKIECIIKSKGNLSLINESKAIKAIATANLRDNGNFIDFDEYISINLKQTIKDSINVTINQLIMYMSFIEDIILPITKLKGYTENKNNAENIYQVIQKIRGKIRKNEEVIQQGNDELEKLEIELYWLEYLYHFRISPSLPPPGHDPHGCLATVSREGNVNMLKYFQVKEELNKKITEKEDKLLDLLEFSNYQGELNRNHEDIKDFFELLKYWKNNFASIYSRREDLRSLAGFKEDKNQSKLTIYRNVTKNEK